MCLRSKLSFYPTILFNNATLSLGLSHWNNIILWIFVLIEDFWDPFVHLMDLIPLCVQSNPNLPVSNLFFIDLIPNFTFDVSVLLVSTKYIMSCNILSSPNIVRCSNLFTLCLLLFSFLLCSLSSATHLFLLCVFLEVLLISKIGLKNCPCKAVILQIDCFETYPAVFSFFCTPPFHKIFSECSCRQCNINECSQFPLTHDKISFRTTRGNRPLVV